MKDRRRRRGRIEEEEYGNFGRLVFILDFIIIFLVWF